MIDDYRLAPAELLDAQKLALKCHELFGVVTRSGDAEAVWNDDLAEREARLSMPPFYLSSHPGQQLGNVWSRIGFERAVAFSLACAQAEAARLTDLLTSATPLTRDERADIDDMLARVTLRSAEVWLFENDDPAAVDPLTGVDIGRLPCGLGLPFYLGEEFLAFKVPIPVDGQAPKRPCVYDVGWFFQEYWRPTGRTRSVCSRLASDGFKEWISPAPKLENIYVLPILSKTSDAVDAAADAYDVPA